MVSSQPSYVPGYICNETGFHEDFIYTRKHFDDDFVYEYWLATQASRGAEGEGRHKAIYCQGLLMNDLKILASQAPFIEIENPF
jgi:hypothetical protein